MNTRINLKKVERLSRYLNHLVSNPQKDNPVWLTMIHVTIMEIIENTSGKPHLSEKWTLNQVLDAIDLVGDPELAAIPWEPQTDTGSLPGVS